MLNKILIVGLPGSGKTALAEPLAEKLGAVHINADQIREEYNDWDFSDEGRLNQAYRMKYLADGIVKAGRRCVVDFVCPTQQTRDIFASDYMIWIDRISQGRFEDTNKIFKQPTNADIVLTDGSVEQWLSQVVVAISVDNRFGTLDHGL